jgi:hypothetical protein
MKRYLYGSAFLLLLSLLLLQSTSFSNTEMLNKATISAVPESQALLSSHYGEGRLFWVTNNTEKAVQVRNTGSISPNESFHIGPGRSNSFTILGHPEEISESILLDVEWDGGYALVESRIPQSNIEQILLELLEEKEETSEGTENVEQEASDEEKAEAVTVQEAPEEDTPEEQMDDSLQIDEIEMTTEIDDEIEE